MGGRFQVRHEPGGNWKFRENLFVDKDKLFINFLKLCTMMVCRSREVVFSTPNRIAWSV
jgi:hypothetical protein